tara:strand:+ start:728 stop:1396 length:669 start_codon:yes stop_codon:yes gene_type:complete
MNRPIKFLTFLLLLVFLSTYFPNYNNKNNSILFPIQTIKIENTIALNIEEVYSALEFLKGESLFFLSKEKIKNSLVKFDFVSSFKVKKIYPSTIKILIIEKKPVAIFFQEKKKFFISDNGDLINYIQKEDFTNLPILFGKKNNFNNLYIQLKKINFPINTIKSFHYFEIDRWDITLKNDKLIRLPKDNYVEILKNFISIKNDSKFKKYKTFDYRIKDQLILN